MSHVRCCPIICVGLLLLAATGTLPAAAPPSSGPLPRTVEPERYLLDLTIDPAAPRFHGHVEIRARLTTPARSIFLHGQGLEVSRAHVINGAKDFDARYTQVGPTGLARLDFPMQLAPGAVTLVFDYSAAVGSSADGLFHTQVGKDWYVWTQAEPISARRIFPGLDEPRFKTPFEIIVRAPPAMQVFSNSSEAKVTAGKGVRVHHFAPTPALPTYLVALGVGSFDVVSATAPPNALRSRPLPIRIVATKGQLPRMHLAAAEIPKILALLEQRVGMAYPYEKLDFLASPTMGGAMENAGLIIGNDAFVLLDPDAPVAQLRGFAEVNAHEMAHQWFGDLVTPAWWSDLWLSESFAQWLGRKVADEWRPELGIDAAALQEAFAAMDVDGLGQARSIRQSIADDSGIVSAFDSITYEKGAQVLAMFESYLGAPAFGAGIRRYLQSHGHAVATADDFFQSLSAAAANPAVVSALQTFINQAGVPVVSVDERGQTIVLRQAPYHPLGIEPPAAQLWKIPVCLTRGTWRQCSLLEAVTSQLMQPNDDKAVLVPDAEGTGYFRFHMAESSWSRLVSLAPTLPARTALAVADSLWADFAAGALGFDRVLGAAWSLSRNPDRLAATELGVRLKHLADTELTDAQIHDYRLLMREIYAPRLAALGLNVRLGAHSHDPVPVQSLREALLSLVALEARDPGARTQLLAAGVAYLHGDRQAIDPSFRETALKVVVQEQGPAVMGQLKDALIRSTDPLVREQLVAAMGSADTGAAARAALDLAWSAGIETQESLRILMSLGAERDAREATIQYVDMNFHRILEGLPAFARPFLLPALFENACSTADADRAESFIRPRIAELGGGQMELAQARETIRLCAQRRQAKGVEIDTALRNALAQGI